MKTINEKLQELSDKSSQITLYKNFDVKTTLKGIGRVPGKFDAQLLGFLKFTNGASILDYCFVGFKNTKLGIDLDKFFKDLWPANDMLTFQFVPFMGTSTNDTFGYLMNVVDSNGNHPIVYNSNDHPEKLHVIASSFERFMTMFLEDVDETINSNPHKFLLGVDKYNWPTDIEHWLKGDDELGRMYNDGTLGRFFKQEMPEAIW